MGGRRRPRPFDGNRRCFSADDTLLHSHEQRLPLLCGRPAVHRAQKREHERDEGDDKRAEAERGRRLEVAFRGFLAVALGTVDDFFVLLAAPPLLRKLLGLLRDGRPEFSAILVVARRIIAWVLPVLGHTLMVAEEGQGPPGPHTGS